MRRIKQQITEEECLDVLAKEKRGILAVNGEGGYPYAVPVNFFCDTKTGKIYFHGAKSGHKLDAVKADDKVCFTTWDDGYLVEGDWAYHVSSCVVFGRASLVTDTDIALEKIRKFAMKYYPTVEEIDAEIRKSFAAAQMVMIDIEHISGKKVHEK